MTDSPEPTLAAAPPPIDPPPVDPPAAAPVIVDLPAPGRAAVTVTRQSRQVIVHGVGFLPTEALIVTVKSADGENWTPSAQTLRESPASTATQPRTRSPRSR